MAQALETKRDPDQSILYEDSWALCVMGIVNAFFEPSSGSIQFRWAHFVGGDMERRALSSLMASQCVLSVLGWFDFVVVILNSFLVDPGPHLLENGCFRSFGTFALTVKKTHLGVNDVAGCTSRGTRRGIRADDVGALRLILMPLKPRHFSKILAAVCTISTCFEQGHRKGTVT